MTTWYNLAPQPNWQEWLGVTISCNPSEFVFAANYLTNTITTSSGSNYFTGKAVMVNSVGGVLPAPLSASAVYYIIFIDSTTFKLATTYANALSSAALTLTDNGSGVLTIISTGTVYLQPNANGYINTYSSLSHQINKPTYTDWTGNTPNSNPVYLDDKGMAVIYWAVNSDTPTDNYYIEIYSPNGTLLYSRDNFNAPPGLEPSSSDSTSSPINLLINNEFDFWGLYDYGSTSVETVSADISKKVGDTEIAYNWYMEKTNANTTDIISRVPFTAGQTEVPNSPVYFLRMQCTNAGIGLETAKSLFQLFNSVQNFAGQTITFSFYAKSAVNGTTISTSFAQNFGDGGSTQVVTEGDDIVLTTVMTLYSTTLAIPDLGGKNIQPGNSSVIAIGLPINSTYTIDIANTQLTISDVLLPYRQLSSNERFALLPASKQELTGTIKVQSFNSFPESWIPFNSGTIGNAISNASFASPESQSLFYAVWENYNDVVCPLYESTGIRVGRGASASEDFAANKKIELFFNSGRAISNTGVPINEFVFLTDFATSDTSLYIQGDGLYANRTLYMGTQVQLTTTGTLPTGLATSTVYFVSPLNASVGQYALSTSFANALAGIHVVISSNGIGIQMIANLAGNDQFKAYVAGEGVGESAHYQIQAELAAHHHVNTAYDSTGLPNATGFSGAAAASGPSNKNSSTVGDGGAMNITQPTLALPHIIKL